MQPQHLDVSPLVTISAHVMQLMRGQEELKSKVEHLHTSNRDLKRSNEEQAKKIASLESEVAELKQRISDTANNTDELKTSDIDPALRKEIRRILCYYLYYFYS
jgi:predicted RNase H-like nuclease (RuvC/YqgF family)